MNQNIIEQKCNLTLPCLGSFHCDEALACFMLKQLPTYADSVVVRTRDPAELAKCDIVVDVGGVFDHSKKLYDHHQRYT